MGRRLLLDSKINWQFKFSEPGLLINLALCQIGIFFVLKGETFLIQTCAVIISCYFLLLLIKKYPDAQKIVLILLILFIGRMMMNLQRKPLTLNSQLQVKIYPDQVKVKDGWLSGKAYVNKQVILISGKCSRLESLKAGHAVALSEIDGEFSQIMPATNIGEFDFKKYYQSKEIYQQLRLKSATVSVIKKVSIIDRLHFWRYKLQQYLSRMPKLLSFFSSELILAENPFSETKSILDNYRNLGVVHLLSISGLHVGIYTSMVSIICYFCKRTEGEAFFCCLLVLLIGIFLSLGQPGFVRASLMYILSRILKFKRILLSKIDILGLTCLLHLLMVPNLFLGVGALLSYLLVLGIQLTQKLSRFKQAVCLNTLITPLLLFFFYQFNVLTILFNCLIVPYFNYLVIPSVFVNLILFPVIPAVSKKLDKVLSITERLLGLIAHSNVGLWTFGKINWWQCLLLLILAAVITIKLNERISRKYLKNWIALLTISYILCFVSIHYPWRGQVTFIDVGQGDSILITTPIFRKVYMIDTGGKLNFSGKKREPQLNKITIPFLKAEGINQIDGVFLSHQDADHVGDLKPLLEQVRVKKLYFGKGMLKNPAFRKRIEGKVQQTQIVELLAGDVINQKIPFSVLHPDHEGEGKNEDSVALTFLLAKKRWLFTGDLDQAGEMKILQKYPNLKVDYFKLGHHGSRTSSKKAFLQAIKPSLAFISAGRNNRFGHPHQETLNTLKELGIPWVSTQDYGMINWYYDLFGTTKFETKLSR